MSTILHFPAKACCRFCDDPLMPGEQGVCRFCATFKKALIELDEEQRYDRLRITHRRLIEPAQEEEPPAVRPHSHIFAIFVLVCAAAAVLLIVGAKGGM